MSCLKIGGLKVSMCALVLLKKKRKRNKKAFGIFKGGIGRLSISGLVLRSIKCEIALFC